MARKTPEKLTTDQELLLQCQALSEQIEQLKIQIQKNQLEQDNRNAYYHNAIAALSAELVRHNVVSREIIMQRLTRMDDRLTPDIGLRNIVESVDYFLSPKFKK